MAGFVKLVDFNIGDDFWSILYSSHTNGRIIDNSGLQLQLGDYVVSSQLNNGIALGFIRLKEDDSVPKQSLPLNVVGKKFCRITDFILDTQFERQDKLQLLIDSSFADNVVLWVEHNGVYAHNAVHVSNLVKMLLQY